MQRVPEVIEFLWILYCRNVIYSWTNSIVLTLVRGIYATCFIITPSNLNIGIEHTFVKSHRFILIFPRSIHDANWRFLSIEFASHSNGINRGTLRWQLKLFDNVVQQAVFCINVNSLYRATIDGSFWSRVQLLDNYIYIDNFQPSGRVFPDRFYSFVIQVSFHLRANCH